MKNVLKFILYSLCMGLCFAIPMMILLVIISKDFDIYAFFSLLWFGPAFTSLMVILPLFNKRIILKMNNNILHIKWDDFINSKLVIIIAIFSFIFCTFIGCSGQIITHYVVTKQYNKAIVISTIRSKIYPHNCEIYHNLSYSYFGKHDYDKAIYYNNKRLQCNPNDYTSHINNAGAIYLKNKDNLNSEYKNIINELDESLKINKDSFTALMGKQDIHFKMHDCESGINDVENILSIIDKKGAEKYKYKYRHKTTDITIVEALPDNWKVEVLKNLTICPNSKGKEKLVKKISDTYKKE